ncbi:hypothetical protein TNIN_233781 [Trichonephila inaurata madagascariensis]|uniref:Uncharacterized protein n=1 Tax=Trichonephila inaurata madagascariensis TaxID=2747483 RepID=A0A8X6XUU8_9ARAC|nr:hypothetical protein TNIN_233781 [Trichonephila inaurata madagascariensis]
MRSVPSLEELALMEVAVAVFLKIKMKQLEIYKTLDMPENLMENLSIMKEVVPKDEIPQVLQEKLKKVITVFGYEHSRRRTRAKIQKLRKRREFMFKRRKKPVKPIELIVTRDVSIDGNELSLNFRLPSIVDEECRRFNIVSNIQEVFEKHQINQRLESLGF